MKVAFTKIVLVIALSVPAVTDVRAEDGFGVGVILGEPTGISLKNWVSETRAIDAAAAWAFSGEDSFQLHTDYLFHRFDIIKTNPVEGKMPIYFGIGARVKFKDDDDDNVNEDDDDDVLAGIRFPIGLSYIFAKTPIDIFGEIVPILDVAPDSEFRLNAAVGIRYYFR